MNTTGPSEFNENKLFDSKCVEIFWIVWLDTNPNIGNSLNAEKKLRATINRLEKFQKVKPCKEFIEQQSQYDRIVLIASGQLGREIVPIIHKLRQVITIYVYCMNKQANRKWAIEYSKVKGVHNDLNELIVQIKSDYAIEKKLQDPWSINIYTNNLDGVLINWLVRLKYSLTDIQELHNYLQQQYKGNDVELNNIDDFKRNYSSQNVLWLYTRESFLYKTFNAVLRKQNIHMSFLLRLFITDIQNQLEANQYKKPIKTYRSQIISTDELNTLKKWCGQFISINSFFSTNTNYPQVRSYLDKNKTIDNLQSVLFEIDADPRLLTSKPFADISGLNYNEDEFEVLFMLGSIFRLNSVNRSHDGKIWMVRMSLCSDTEQDLKDVFNCIKHYNGNGETNLRILGDILWKMGKIDLAEQYFIRFLNNLPPNDPMIYTLYENLNALAKQIGDENKSLQYHNKLVELKKTNLSLSTIEMNRSGNGIVMPNIPVGAKWSRNGITVAGDYGWGSSRYQLSKPHTIYLDDDHTMLISDSKNHRILQWKKGETFGNLVAGGHGVGNQLDQLDNPTSIIVEKMTNSLIISDRKNQRVVRWPRHNNVQGQPFFDNVHCTGLAIDEQGYLYISFAGKSEVRRYQIGNRHGVVVAGGHGPGSDLNQLHDNNCIFVDREQAVYIADCSNHRIMKWNKDATKGIIVAGGCGPGSALRQLLNPSGVCVDELGTVYVVDQGNHRVMRWLKNASDGTIIVGQYGRGSAMSQLNSPTSLVLDEHGNLYVADTENHRIQFFSMKSTRYPN